MPTSLFDCTHSKKKNSKKAKGKESTQLITMGTARGNQGNQGPEFFLLKKVCCSPLIWYFFTLLTALYHILCQYIIRQQQNYILHNYIKRQKKIYYILCLKVITFLWYRMVYYVSLQYLYFFKIHEKTREKSENHLPKASHSQTFLVFSQHPKWVIMRINRWKVRSIFFIT